MTRLVEEQKLKIQELENVMHEHGVVSVKEGNFVGGSRETESCQIPARELEQFSLRCSMEVDRLRAEVDASMKSIASMQLVMRRMNYELFPTGIAIEGRNKVDDLEIQIKNMQEMIDKLDMDRKLRKVSTSGR